MTSIAFFQSAAGIVRSNGEEFDLVLPGGTLSAEIEAKNSLEHLSKAQKGEALKWGSFDVELPYQPGTFILVGMNYASHAEEAGMGIPEELLFGPIEKGFPATKPGATVALPLAAPDHVDYEGEIGIVVGRTTPEGGVSVDEAPDYILGLTSVIDLSARDVQLAAIQAGGGDLAGSLAASKSFPGFKPFGPGIQFFTREELRDPDVLLETRVNGEVRQSASAEEMIFSVCECLSRVSQSEALQPGDVICSGTPGGVGFFSNKFLRSGDQVSVTVGILPELRVSMS